jgi:hypothetical protein
LFLIKAGVPADIFLPIIREVPEIFVQSELTVGIDVAIPITLRPEKTAGSIKGGRDRWSAAVFFQKDPAESLNNR